jgi:uncharacterized RDD family membrane protein YckC
MVTTICPYCGAVNNDPAETCCICDARLRSPQPSSLARPSVPRTQGNLAVDPNWRREASERLHAYRTRHGAPTAELQPPLPFESAGSPTPDGAQPGSGFVSTATPGRAPRSRTPRTERVEISVPGREPDAPGAGIRQRSGGLAASGTALDPLFPVASLAERRRAALLDSALLVFSYGGMLALFWTLGGRIEIQKVDAVVAGATLVLFYAQYFSLFTVFGGSTPGMMLCGLRVIGFDGGVPTPRQLIWRSFGYLVSAGTCLLGFLWALWDDDHLSWHDRISQTYLTSAAEGVPGEGASSSGRYRQGLPR